MTFVTIVQHDRTSSHLYLVLEYVENTLLEHIERHAQGMPQSKLGRLSLQLTKALAYMHSIRVRWVCTTALAHLLTKCFIVLCFLLQDYIMTRMHIRCSTEISSLKTFSSPVRVW